MITQVKQLEHSLLDNRITHVKRVVFVSKSRHMPRTLLADLIYVIFFILEDILVKGRELTLILNNIIQCSMLNILNYIFFHFAADWEKIQSFLLYVKRESVCIMRRISHIILFFISNFTKTFITIPNQKLSDKRLQPPPPPELNFPVLCIYHLFI